MPSQYLLTLLLLVSGMKRSQSYEYLGDSVSSDGLPDVELLSNKQLKRLQAKVDRELENRERHIVIIGGDGTDDSLPKNRFIITINLRYTNELQAQFLEEWLQEWFFYEARKYNDNHDCGCVFLTNTESETLEHINNVYISDKRCRVRRVSWTDLRPIKDLEDHLTQMEKKNGEKWNGRWTQPNYEDVLNILLPSS
jgi:hypothetical protein